MSTDIEHLTPSVETLSQRKFFVPAYQRGYRWTPDEVRDLLEDIRRFSETTSHDPAEFYCLQPLVVRRSGLDEWEVIDGQQRLTTIYLISRYINEMWRGRDKDAVFALRYETRERTKDFLDGLVIKDDGSVDFNDENIDFAHISRAYQIISEWVKSFGSNLAKDHFMSAFRRRVRVIWYEPSGSDGVQIFTRINSGKIPLTNAELIRGLFLKSSNFTIRDESGADPHFAGHKQMEISGEWDRIEAALHDDKFWYFLTDSNDSTETRIDLIFRLLTGIYEEDSYALFREYARHFPDKPEVGTVLEKWDKVKSCFQQLQAWYQEWDMYHLIGYLIAIGDPSTLQKLWNESRGLRKTEFRASLKRRMQESIPKNLDTLQYGQSGVRNVLLLHNILTTLESAEKHFRFPLNRYKQKEQKWDVEHIHSVAEKAPETEPHQRDWLKDAAKYLPDAQLQMEVADFLNKKAWNESEFQAIYQKVLKSFSEDGKAESINDLSNLALLDRSINRGYGNAVFPAKRAKIIDSEREGKFIPIATKNAFLKYYSESVQEFTFWSKTDRQAYSEAIQNTIDLFFSEAKGVLQ